MKKILVPMDFSDYSNNAFRMAAYFAKAKGMSIKLLHIMENSESPITHLPLVNSLVNKKSPEYEAELKSATEEHLKRLASLENTEGIPVEYEVRDNKIGVAKEILKEECDLIVIGRRKEKDKEKIWVGSVSEKIMRLSSLPIITVGKLPPYYAIHNIVFASDFKDPDIAPFIDHIFELSFTFKAKVHFLFAMLNRDLLSEKQSREAVEEITRNFDLRGHNVDVYVAQTEEDAISEFAEDTGADLLVLCTHGRKRISRLLFASVSQNLAAFASMPVLTQNITAKKAKGKLRPLKREKRVRMPKKQENL